MLMNKVKQLLGIILVGTGFYGLMVSGSSFYRAINGQLDSWGVSSSVGNSLFALVLMLAIFVAGIILLRSSKAIKSSKNIALDKLGESPKIHIWLIANEREPIKGVLQLNVTNRQIVITGESGQTLMNTSFDSENLAIKRPLSMYQKALLVTNGSEKFVISFTEDRYGYRRQRRNMHSNVLFGWLFSAASQGPETNFGYGSDWTHNHGYDLNEYLHKWFRGNKAKSYKNRFSAAGIMMTFYILLLPALFLILAISVAIFG